MLPLRQPEYRVHVKVTILGFAFISTAVTLTALLRTDLFFRWQSFPGYVYEPGSLYHLEDIPNVTTNFCVKHCEENPDCRGFTRRRGDCVFAGGHGLSYHTLLTHKRFYADVTSEQSSDDVALHVVDRQPWFERFGQSWGHMFVGLLSFSWASAISGR